MEARPQMRAGFLFYTRSAVLVRDLNVLSDRFREPTATKLSAASKENHKNFGVLLLCSYSQLTGIR